MNRGKNKGHDSEQTIILEARVIPRSSKTEILPEGERKIKIRITAPPVDGKANIECIKAISRYLGVRKNQIEIASGEKSRNKLIKITNLSAAERGHINKLLKNGVNREND